MNIKKFYEVKIVMEIVVIRSLLMQQAHRAANMNN